MGWSSTSVLNATVSDDSAQFGPHRSLCGPRIGAVHPIERLRFVARAQDLPSATLAAEAASALVMFSDEPAALVSASRRVLSRQLSCGPLWWVCARLLAAGRVRDAAAEAISELESDTTIASSSLALDGLATERSAAGFNADDDSTEDVESDLDQRVHPGELGVELIDARVIGEGAAIVDGARWETFDRSARQRWLVGGVGHHLHENLWSSLVTHWSDSRAALDSCEVLVPIETFTHVVGPSGLVSVNELGEPDCPMAPELARLAG